MSAAFDIRIIDLVDALVNSRPDEDTEYDLWCGWVCAAEAICQGIKDRNDHFDETLFMNLVSG